LYHTFLFTYRLEKEKLKDNQIWEAKLSCGCIIQFAARTKAEIKNDGLQCPIHTNKYPGFISPIFQEIVAFRKVKLESECKET
jgi:hypothetical protein